MLDPLQRRTSHDRSLTLSTCHDGGTGDTALQGDRESYFWTGVLRPPSNSLRGATASEAGRVSSRKTKQQKSLAHSRGGVHLTGGRSPFELHHVRRRRDLIDLALETTKLVLHLAGLFLQLLLQSRRVVID